MNYYTAEQAASDIYIQFPKWLINMDLSSDAKLLYVYLLDRHKLSLKNGWIDKNNHVYLIFTRAAMQEILGCSKTTAIKAAKALEDAELIEEKRVPNKPSKIYLLQPPYDYIYGNNSYDDDLDEYDEQGNNKNWKSKKWTSKNYTSGSPNSIPSEVQNLDPNKNNSSKNNMSKNNIYNNDDIVDTLKIVGEEDSDNSVVVKENGTNSSSISFSRMTVKQMKKECEARELAIKQLNEAYDAFKDPRLKDDVEDFPDGLYEFNAYHNGKAGVYPFRFHDIGFNWVRGHDMYHNAQFVKKAEELVKDVFFTFSKADDRLALTLIDHRLVGEMIENISYAFADPDKSEIHTPRNWCASILRSKIEEIKRIFA
ncbi:MAG: replication initiator protein A [Erysipelotrichaceae bacterium]|nr:replication initiator protein A [Erysipelotrichaceae bacterium]